MKVSQDILYLTQDDSSTANPRHTLDVYLPKNEEAPYPLLVWFHGGGLTNRSKEGQADFATAMAQRGIGVVVPNYRLSPTATYPTYIEDAAAATAWVKNRVSELGGDPKRLFVGGHSAGGYLALMLAMNTNYLAAARIKQQEIAGYIPVSAQTVTHFTVRQERGLERHQVVADEAAPVYYCRAGTQPILLIVGDNDYPARLEENAFFAASLKAAGNQRVRMEVAADRDHLSIRSRMADPTDPTAASLEAFIKSPSCR